MIQIVIIIAAFLMLIFFAIIILRFAIDQRITVAAKHHELDNLDFKTKKISIAKLDRYHGLLLGFGFILTLGLVNLIIEWKSFDEKEIIHLGDVEDNFEEVYEIPPTTQPPPPKPKLQHPEIVEVSNEEELKQEIDINLDVELTEDSKSEEVERITVFEEAAPEIVEEIFLVVQDQPEPIGGIAAFYDFLGEKIRYPEEARRMGISGRVFVEFVIDKDGSITQAKAVKGIGGGCDEEAVRVVMSAPKWKPGLQRGRPVKVRMTIPVYFMLQ